MQIRIIGDTIEIDGREVARITIPNGTLREQLEAAIGGDLYMDGFEDGKVEGEEIGYTKGFEDGKDAARDEMEGRV